MPTTWNGTGTSYWGKRNKHQRVGVCEQCGKLGVLTSYETPHYAVFLHIPVFPLGEVQVIDQCGACTRHMASPLRKFKKNVMGELVESLQRIRENPGDADLMRNALGLAGGSWNRPAFASLATQARAAFPNDPLVWGAVLRAHPGSGIPARARQRPGDRAGRGSLAA